MRQRVRHTLLALQRKALSNREEKGIETLHLAMGMATWPTPDGGRPYNSPVILLPARIELRGRAGQNPALVVAGEPQLNPVLLYSLEETYTVRVCPSDVLSACGGEDESEQWRVDPECVLASLERTTTAVPGFVVKRRVILANFQFAKMAMVEDLKKNGETMNSSTIIAAIAGHPGSRQKLAEAVRDIKPVQLDERPACDDCLVLDADSTQHRAIVVVGKGQSCVVQGPPGTGKSQTIANLIAQTVGDGRRVLFVAEKRAALDAVIKRLTHPNVGLSHLVLDLHGASVSRKTVMARLAHTLGQIRQSLPADGAEAVHRGFDARRKQLNEHARRVNQVRQPCELSVNQMIGRLLCLPSAAKSPHRLRGETLKSLTAARVGEVKQWIREGATNPTLLLGTDPSLWNKADITDGRHAQEALDLATRAAFDLWPEFQRSLGKVVQRFGIRPPGTLEETATVLAALREVNSILEQYAAQIFAEKLGDMARTLEPATGGLMARTWAYLSNGAYRAARRRLLSLRTTAASAKTLHEEALAPRMRFVAGESSMLQPMCPWRRTASQRSRMPSPRSARRPRS